MKTNGETTALERLLRPLPAGFTVELARALVDLRADAATQGRYDDLAGKRTEGKLSEAEAEELEAMVRANTMLSFLKSEAQAVLNGR